MVESFELSALLISVVTGLLLGIPSGPAHFYVLDTSLKEGAKAALTVYGGFMVAKLVYIGLALLAHDFIAAHKTVESAFFLVASFLLVVWGVIIILKSNKHRATKQQVSPSLFRNGFIIGLSNPIIPLIYLTFLQFIKAYAKNISLFKYLLNISIMEAISFVVLSLIAWTLMRGGRLVQLHWNKVIRVMGILLVCAGSYQLYQLIELRQGEVQIRQEENMLEEQLEELEEESQQ